MGERQPPLRLRVLPGSYTICRLAAAATLPVWAQQPAPVDALLSITRTADELSIVCPQSVLPPATESASEPFLTEPFLTERDWRCLCVVGPLDFSLVGILARLATALAAANISLFALSTYDTDYLLVKADRLTEALVALSSVAQIE